MEPILRERGIVQDVIDKMIADKIDCDIFTKMTDEQLKHYIPAYGDRIAVMAFASIQALMTQKSTNSEPDITEHLQNKRCIKSQWLLHNLASDGAVLVSLLFWTTAYDGSGVTLINCTTHRINAVFVLMDMLISRTRIRMLHLYQCSCFGLVYTTFSYIYHLCGGSNHKGEPYICKHLDYSNLQVAVSTALVSIFLVGPLIHCWIFFLYRFRLFIHRYLRAMERRVDHVGDKTN